jgi:hypothetical protein
MQVDPEVLLIAWINANLPATAVPRLPADYPAGSFVAGMPYVHVTHIGGADDIPTLAELSIDLDYYAATLTAASTLARQGHHAVRYDLPGSILTRGDMSATVTNVRPGFLPRRDETYGNPDVCRYLSNYAITFKTRTA